MALVPSKHILRSISPYLPCALGAVWQQLEELWATAAVPQRPSLPPSSACKALKPLRPGTHLLCALGAVGQQLQELGVVAVVPEAVAARQHDVSWLHL